MGKTNISILETPWIKGWFAALTDNEIEVIRRYHGYGYKKETVREIGVRYNISTYRVNKIRTKAYAKLAKLKKLGLKIQ